MDDDVIHVCVRVAGHEDVIPGSATTPCEQCGQLCWVDLRSCREIPPFHRHACIVCFPPGEYPGEVLITRASVERARRHLRRRWN